MSTTATDYDRIFSVQYSRLIARTGRLLPPGIGDPEDFVHLAYLRCRTTWVSVKSSSFDHGAYFLRSIRWLVADALRRRRREAGSLKSSASLHPISAASDISTATAHDLFDQLPRRQRELGLALLRGESAAEIEKRLGLSKGARSVGVSRLRKSLIAFL